MTFTDISQTLDSLYALNRRGIKMGLQHTFSLLHFLNNPQRNFKIIHIAGTNGKGSTAAMINNILKYHGYKVGLYTSPHLLRFNERIRINSTPISNQEILSFMGIIKPVISDIKSTFFEVTTAMAFSHFNNQNVDIAVIETGLGGRLDSTNVVDPNLTIMTPISMDHMEILGDNIIKIANEKAGIIKKGVTLISSKQNKNVLNVLLQVANKRQAVVNVSESPSDIILESDGTKFHFLGNDYKTSMIGSYQADNAALAISAIKYFDKSIQNKTINEGLKNVQWPGRLQPVSKGVYYDVAHNAEGIKSMLKNLKNFFPIVSIYGLFCIKGEKDLQYVAKEIKENFEILFVTTNKQNSLLSPTTLSNKLKKFNVESYSVKSIRQGIKKLKKIMKSHDILLIFGSHYIAEEVFEEFEISFDSGEI